MTAHGLARIDYRDIDPRLIPVANFQASKCTTSTAVRLAKYDVAHRNTKPGSGYGDEVWMIVADARPITFVWHDSRRPINFKVNEIRYWN